MAAVAGVTMLAAWTIQLGRLGRHFNLPQSEATEPSPAD
jgi:hypothetical protein